MKVPQPAEPETEWVEISVTVDNEAVEPVSALLSRYGSVAIEKVTATPTSAESLPPIITVRCYLPRDEASKSQATIEEGLWHLGQLLPMGEPQSRTLTESDWMDAWKEHYPIVHVGERIVILPAWREYEAQPGEVVVAVNPGMAFGTGLHPSTQLCLEALETFLQEGDEVLDVGTGTGILAIAAAKMGAQRVLALDVEPAAVRAARQNSDLNRVGDKIQVSLGSVIPVKGLPGIRPVMVDRDSYDLILVNIIAETIANMAPMLCHLTRPRGLIITSGIITEREELVVEAYAGRAELAKRSRNGDWLCLCFRALAQER